MPALSGPDPSGLPLLVTIDEARAHGLTADQVRQRVRSGRWRPVARGVYLRTAAEAVDVHESARLAHVHRALAAAMTHADAVIALRSAAAVHALPTVSGLPPDVHLISPRGRSGSRDGVAIHRLPLEATDVVLLPNRPGSDPADRHLSVTTPLRTWVDITRTSTLADSLAVGDRGLRGGLFTQQDLIETAGRVRGRGCRRLVNAAGLAHGGRETPIESWSAACFHEWGLPEPVVQAVIVDDSGRFVGRLDFLWEEAGVIGEADGALKYVDQAALYAEKRREDRLRELGFRVIRWGWADLRRPDRLRQRLESALRVSVNVESDRRRHTAGSV